MWQKEEKTRTFWIWWLSWLNHKWTEVLPTWAISRRKKNHKLTFKITQKNDWKLFAFQFFLRINFSLRFIFFFALCVAEIQIYPFDKFNWIHVAIESSHYTLWVSRVSIQSFYFPLHFRKKVKQISFNLSQRDQSNHLHMQITEN